MYVPSPYQEEESDEIRRFIDHHPFAALVSQVKGKLWATHLPFFRELDEHGKDVLHTHLAKRNPQWKELSGTEPMIIFQGPNAYVSSAWYEEESVPTWNYVAVHAYGRARILEGEELIDSMRKQVEQHEKGSPDPVSVDTMSKELFERELPGLVGLKIEVDRFLPAFKLSQDKSEGDQRSVIDALEQKDDPAARATAEEMKRRGGKE